MIDSKSIPSHAGHVARDAANRAAKKPWSAMTAEERDVVIQKLAIHFGYVLPEPSVK